MKLVREFSADRINKIVNDPSVYEWVRGSFEGPLDLTILAQNHNHVFLVGDHGGVIFLQHQPGFYEIHTQALPSGRGQWALEMVQSAFHYIFTATDCVEVTTRVPKGNLGARAMTRAVHGVFEFRNERGWAFKGKPTYADIYSWKIQDWIRLAPGLVEEGQWFHRRLDAEYDKMGKQDNHPEDPIHDRYVGAAVSMIIGGQPNKGVIFYNRWARMAGYKDVEIVSSSPLVLDIRDSLLMFRDRDFWVMKCL